MADTKQDRRIRYTKMTLREALLRLMERRDIGTITITELCREADINRGTFYMHYADQHDLLHQIEQEFYEDIQTALKRNSKDGAFSASDATREILEHIYTHRALCKILLGEHGDREFVEKIIRIPQEPLFEDWARIYSGTGTPQYAYIYAYVANGCIGILQQWLQSGLREPPSEIARLLIELSAGASGAMLHEL